MSEPERAGLPLRKLLAAIIDEELGTGNTPIWMLEGIESIFETAMLEVIGIDYDLEWAGNSQWALDIMKQVNATKAEQLARLAALLRGEGGEA